jgi:hypothetical protein
MSTNQEESDLDDCYQDTVKHFETALINHKQTHSPPYN